MERRLEQIGRTLRDEYFFIRRLVANPNFWCVLVLDILLITLSLDLSYHLRFEGAFSQARASQLITLLPLLICVKVFCFYLFGLYRGMWRYTSLIDVANIFKATILSALLVVVILLYFNRFEGLSRSIFILDTFLTFLFVVLHRVSIRFYSKSSSGRRIVVSTPHPQREPRRLLIIGAGDAAENVLRELQGNPNLMYKVVGLMDDDPRKTGMEIHGIPVVGRVDDLAEHAGRINAEELLIAISSISAEDMKRIVKLCQACKLPYKVLPGLGELIGSKPFFDSIREIDYRDLLGRQEVRLDNDKIGEYLSGKTVLVTGAGGSIGSELCRQIINYAPATIILFDAGEENLYRIQMELRHGFQAPHLIAILGKVQDAALLDWVCARYQPSVVFHAAAYKHVPLLEHNPWQAVDNNIIGSQRLIEASIIHKVDRFVLVSTDKAVRPTNVMGASKRITELIMHAYSRGNWDGVLSPIWGESQPRVNDHDTIFMAVRFGNVIGSSGSVLPLFKHQIMRGGPVTVTDPEAARYFMSVDEAAQLIIQAGSMGDADGKVFILKMGESIKIAHMAADMIRLSGKAPGKEIEIVFTGLREGEKLCEELFTEGEEIVETGHDKILVVYGNGSFPRKFLQQHIDTLEAHAALHDSALIRKTLMAVVPEYYPN